MSWLIGRHYAVRELWHAPNPDAFSSRTSYGIVLVVTLGFLAVAAIALGRLNRIDWPWLTMAGALTYPFYLVHEHLGWVSVDVLHQGLGLPASLTLGLTLAGMLVLAWVLHRGVEVRLGPALRRSLDRSRR